MKRGFEYSDVAVWALCAAAVLFGAWGLHVGWHNGILDVHGWRQSHTAISVQEMLRGGPFWRYRTPIFGPPWQWPLEWPLYQWIVATASRLFATPIEPVGRAVGVGFFAGALAGLWFVLDVFAVSPRHRPIVIALVCASPLYVFWSRTFMIESTALCAAMWYAAAVHRATTASPPNATRAAIAAALTGALAGAIKVTTFTPFWAAAALMVILRWRNGSTASSRLWTAAAALLIPGLATAAWLLFADLQKLTNPIAMELVWAGERQQRFGTLADRLDWRAWSVVIGNAVLGKTKHTTLASPWVFAAACAALAATRRRFGQALICGLLYLLPIALFMTLFRVHVYYAYENGFLLLLIVGLAIVACLEGPMLARCAGVALFATSLAAMSAAYLSGYFVDQNAGAMAPVTIGLLTSRLTSPDAVMLIYGLRYAPEVPYEASRRAIMDEKNRSVADPAIRQPLEALARDGERVGAIVVCGEARGLPVIRANIQSLSFPERPRYTEPYCELYIRP